MSLNRAFATFASICTVAITAGSSYGALASFQAGVTFVEGNTLTGNVTTEVWSQLTTARINNNPVTPGNNSTRPYGFHGLTNAWAQTLVSNEGANAGASTLWKSGGYGYIAGSSLHQGVGSAAILPGGNFTITGSSIEGLETVIFQIQATDRNESIFYNSVLPTLTINGETVSADFIQLYATIDNFSVGGFGAQDMDFYAFQWDLSGLDITAGTQFTIDWTGISNSGIYELQVNQGDTFTQVVPEPTTGVLLGLGVAAMILRRRR